MQEERPEAGAACIHDDLKLDEKTGRIEEFVTHTLQECLHLVTISVRARLLKPSG